MATTSSIHALRRCHDCWPIGAPADMSDDAPSFSEGRVPIMASPKWIACAITVSITAMAAPALADDGFGKTGQIMISAERLFGLTFPSVVVEDGETGNKTTSSRTNIALLGAPVTPLSSLAVIHSPYDIPRAAIDFNVAMGFTVGGAIGFTSSSGKIKREPAMGGMSVENDDATITMFTISPRVGYVVPIIPMIAFWPRAGVTFYTNSAERTSTGNMPVTTKQKLNGFAVDIEPMFVFMPASHFGITV